MTAATDSRNATVDPREYRRILEIRWRDHVARITVLSIELHDPAETPDGPPVTDPLALRRLQGTAEVIAAARYELREIEAALSRLDAGSFGTCEQCTASLPADRLAAEPHARYCADCAIPAVPAPR